MDSIRIERMSGNWYRLFINDKLKDLPGFSTSKIALRRFLKRKYNMDLRTDKRIVKNYIEFSVRLTGRTNSYKIYIKTKL